MTTLEQLCKALGWQGGTIHDALAEVRRLRAKSLEPQGEEVDALRARVAELELYQKKAQEALRLSGKMYLVGAAVTKSTAHNFSSWVKSLDAAAEEYNTYIIKWTQEK